MGHHHVAKRAHRLIKAGAFAEAQRLGHVDLHMVDEVPVPDRLEQAVGEAEGQDVLRGLLAQEVVDPEDLRLVEGLVDEVVQLDRALQVGTLAFSDTALCRSVPKGFSMMMRLRGTRPASASSRTAGRAALGGTLK